MKEYIADQKIGKTLYKRTKKLYKRYKYGMLVIALIIAVMIVSNVRMLLRAENMSQIPEIMILVIGEDILFLLAVAIVRALAISGGREVLMSRLAEKCFFTEESFVLEYVPNAHETTAYECIKFKFDYKDIRQIINEEQFGRLALYGPYTVYKYRTRDSESGMDSYVISDMPLYVYGYYKEFDQIKNKLFHATEKPEWCDDIVLK